MRLIHGEKRYGYPYKEFWKIAKKVGNEIIIGIDAHFPGALDLEKIQPMRDFIKELDLKVIEKIQL